MKSIQVYGVGCSSCDKLYQMAKEIVQELGKDIQVEKIEDFQKLLEAGVLQTPALAFDNKLVLQGKMPTAATLRNWILKHD